MPTRLLLGSEAQEVLRHLHPSTKKQIRAALKTLKATWPSPKGLDVISLHTEPSRPAFRLRVGNWRVVLRARGETLEVLRVFHRQEGSGWLERL